MAEIDRDSEIYTEVQTKLQELSEQHSRSYDYVREQLSFRDGDQWEPDVLAARKEDGRPSLVLNLTKSYCNRITNPLRMNPLGIQVNLDSPELSELVTDVVRDIEATARAEEAYEQAYDNAVGGGLGWVVVGTDYENDESLEQKVTIDLVRDPTSIWLDPYAVRVDGSDARYGARIKYMDKDEAKRKYGSDAVGEGPFGIDICEYWHMPADSVVDLTYYVMKEDEVDRYWYEDGSTTDEAPPEDIEYKATRKVKKKYCCVYRFVGNAQVGKELKLPIPYIPLVPCYADRLQLNNSQSDIEYAGVPHWLMPSQRMTNYYGSNELELSSLAPKAPFIAAEGQIEGHEDIWDSANRLSHSVLTYKPETLGGQLLPKPERADNQAQTSGLMQSRQQSQADMGRQIGIFDNMMGESPGANQTGKAALINANQGELPTAHYLQNLEQTIAQVGRVVLHMAAYVGDTPRMIGVRDAEGKRVLVETTLKEVLTPEVLANAEVTTSAGPAYESRRRESINAILQLAQIMPDKMGAMADLLVRNMDAPGSQEIADRLYKTLDPALKDDEQGPSKEELQMQLEQSNQQLQAQTQHMEKLEGIIQQLQAQIISNDKDNRVKLAQTLIKEEGSMARELIKQNSEDERVAVKIEAEAESDMRKFAGDALARQDEVDMQAVAAFESDNFVPQVKGPIAVDTSKSQAQAQSNDATLNGN